MNELDACEKYLISNNIPYKKNISFPYGLRQNTAVKFHFIIPGGIIHIKNNHYDRKTRYMNQKLVSQLSKYFDLVPENFTFYIFFAETLEPDVEEFFNFDERVKIIYSYDLITFKQIPYYIEDPGILRSFGSFNNTDFPHLLTRYKDSQIFTNQECYNRAIVIMDDDEIKRLSEFDIHISDCEPHEYITITTYDKSQDNADFNIFTDQVKYYSLKNAAPLKIIEGITESCHDCGKILFCNKVCYNCKYKN